MLFCFRFGVLFHFLGSVFGSEFVCPELDCFIIREKSYLKITYLRDYFPRKYMAVSTPNPMIAVSASPFCEPVPFEFPSALKPAFLLDLLNFVSDSFPFLAARC